MLRSLNFRYHPHPKGTIEMHTIAGYEYFVGYAITKKGEVYTSKQRDELGNWKLMKIDSRGLFRFTVNRKECRICPQVIKELFNQNR